MTGRDMIKAATIRAQIAQIQSYQTAVNSFTNKYESLPGDLPPAIATQFGFTTRSGAANQGDNNTQINAGCGTLDVGCENALFWNDLSYSGIIYSSFTTATDAQVNAPLGTVGNYLPEAKIKGNYIISGYITTNAYVTALSNSFTIIGVSHITAGSATSAMNITPQDASNIDLKIDDGKPISGSVFTTTIPAAAAVGICATDTTGAPPYFYNTTTNIYANTNACNINVKF